MKLFVVVLMLALSGVVHAAAALPMGSDAAEAKGADCPDCEEGCDSPLCSDCVCSFGARSLPSALPLLSAPPMIGMIDGPVVVTATPPTSPEPGDVFHPPRR